MTQPTMSPPPVTLVAWEELGSTPHDCGGAITQAITPVMIQGKQYRSEGYSLSRGYVKIFLMGQSAPLICLARATATLARVSITPARVSVTPSRASVTQVRASITLIRATVTLVRASIALVRASITLARASITLARAARALRDATRSLQRPECAIRCATASLPHPPPPATPTLSPETAGTRRFPCASRGMTRTIRAETG